MGDIARCSIGKPNELYNEELLYKLFGINAELLIDHAWGYEPCTMEQVKAYKPETNSVSSGQVLHCPYDYDKAKLIVKEMTDQMVLDLVDKGLVTDQLVLTIGYDIENLSNPNLKYQYKGEESTDEIGGQVGARLAEILGTGFVSSVIEAEPQDDGLVAKQETEEGYIRYSVAQPAVFTIAKPAYDPRYPNIKAKLAARKAVVPVFSAADADISGEESRVALKGYSEPPKRSAGIRIKEKEAADAVSKAMEKMLQDKAL